MKRLSEGHTNEVFETENNEILIKKAKNGFNHKINYNNLNEFDFVPKLLEDGAEEQKWEKINGELLVNPTDKDLTNLAITLRKVHASDVNFPKNNLRSRANTYLKIVHDKYIKLPQIDEPWKDMMGLLSKMTRLNPSHNDVWNKNIIKDSNDKIWLVDWEYATMGDKHFDLAFYIESERLSKTQEEVFLNAYNSTEEFQAYIPEWMDRYKLLVNWITLLWAYAQDELPFNVDGIIKRIDELRK